MPSVSLSGIFSGNSTAQTVASGKVLPVADATGVTVDTTTYNDTSKGSGKLTTLVFPADAGALAIAISGDAFPRIVIPADPTDAGAFCWGDGTLDPVLAGATISYHAAGQQGILFNATGFRGPGAFEGTGIPNLNQLSPVGTIVGGALPTHDFTGQTGVGQQISTARDVDIYVETGTAGSVVAALSSDNVTYTTIYTKTTAATDVCHARVPAGWYLKLTATTAVLGVGTYA